MYILDDQALDLPSSSSNSNVKQKWLLDLCETLVDNCITMAGDISRLVNQTIDFSQMSKGPFVCRHSGCHNEYVYHSRRVR